MSVKGETRSERYSATEDLWKWIDAHGKDFGVGRPYLDKDPPHVAPIDGKEYAVKRGGAKPQLAGSETKKSQRASVRDVPSATDRAKLSKGEKLRSLTNNSSQAGGRNPRLVHLKSPKHVSINGAYRICLAPARECGCVCRKLKLGHLVMQSAEDRVEMDAPSSLNRARENGASLSNERCVRDTLYNSTT